MWPTDDMVIGPERAGHSNKKAELTKDFVPSLLCERKIT